MTDETVTNSILSVSNDGKLSLEHVISMLSTQHDDKTVIDLVRKLCLQNSRDEFMKKGMEFLYMNGFYDDLKVLIQKNKKSTKQSNNNWADVYQLSLERKLSIKSPLEVLHHAESLHSNEPELKWLLEFVKLSAYYDLREFAKIGDFLDRQANLFDAIHDPFLISYFNVRIDQYMFIYYWVRNELIMARKHAFRVLNQTHNPGTTASININLGLTYTFDTYKQGIHHINEAIKVSKENGLVNYVNAFTTHDLPFFSAHFRRIEGITTTDISERAHLEIARGNLKSAEKILRKLPYHTPFQLYYLGVAANDKFLLHKSYHQFIEKRSDYFFARLPMLALQEMGA